MVLNDEDNYYWKYQMKIVISLFGYLILKLMKMVGYIGVAGI